MVIDLMFVVEVFVVPIGEEVGGFGCAFAKVPGRKQRSVSPQGDRVPRLLTAVTGGSLQKKFAGETCSSLTVTPSSCEVRRS